MWTLIKFSAPTYVKQGAEGPTCMRKSWMWEITCVIVSSIVLPELGILPLIIHPIFVFLPTFTVQFMMSPIQFVWKNSLWERIPLQSWNSQCYCNTQLKKGSNVSRNGAWYTVEWGFFHRCPSSATCIRLARPENLPSITAPRSSIRYYR